MRIDTYTMLGKIVKDKDGQAQQGEIDVMLVADLDKYIHEELGNLRDQWPVNEYTRGREHALDKLAKSLNRRPQ